MEFQSRSPLAGSIHNSQYLLWPLTLFLVASICGSHAVAQESAVQPLAVPAEKGESPGKPAIEGDQTEPADRKVPLSKQHAPPEITAGGANVAGQKPRLGVIVLDSPGRGVFVAAVDPFGPAMRAGLRPGDYLLKAGNVEICGIIILRVFLAASGCNVIQTWATLSMRI